MANTLRIKRSSTASAVPTGLQAGELAVNTTDKRLYVGDGTNTHELTRRASNNDTNGEIQFSSTGLLSSNPAFTYTATNHVLTISAWSMETLNNEGKLTYTANPSKTLVVQHNSVGNIVVGDYDGNGNATKITVNDTDSVVSVTNNLYCDSTTSTKYLALLDADLSNSITLQAPSTVSSNVTLTLPATAGSNGQVLTTNGTGTLSWTTPSGSGASVPDFLLFNAGII